MKKLLFFIFLIIHQFAFAQTTDPLPAWNDGAVKSSIIQFVEKVTNKNGPHYVAPEERIAVFDNDGTLWIEQPAYTQAIFALSRVKTMAAQHPEWKTLKPFSYILSDNKQAISNLTQKDIARILVVTHTGMTVEDFKNTVKNWLANTKDPHFNRLYTQLVYQPMLEVMNYLRDNQFKIYIVSGGGQDFVRAFAETTYGVVPEQVIGSAGKTKYNYQNGKATITKIPQLLFVSNYAGKPEAIDLIIGRKPIIAFGNSDGDRQMLEWTQSSDKEHLMLLVHHDDAKREFAYGPKSKVGTFSDSLMAEAVQNHWQVISMKRDWNVIFPK